MNITIKIACLPKAGIGNPYQFLMMEGLAQDDRLIISHGNGNRLIGILLTAIFQRPDYIHFDWIDGLYARRSKVLMYINMYFFYVQLWLLNHIFRIKIVSTLHNLHPHDATNISLHNRVYKRFYRCCKWIRVFHSGTADKASALYEIPESRFKVIPEGDFTSYYENNTDRNQSRNELEISPDKKVYLFLGNIRPYKGLEELIEVFQKVREPHDLLIITGRCPDSQYLQNLQSNIIDEQAIMLREGFVPRDYVQVYMHASDIVILPFAAIENSGSAILAMGFGKAVIAPSKGVLPQRLSCQSEFVYDENKLADTIIKSQGYASVQLAEIGLQNKIALNAHVWGDFTQAFT